MKRLKLTFAFLFLLALSISAQNCDTYELECIGKAFKLPITGADTIHARAFVRDSNSLCATQFLYSFSNNPEDSTRVLTSDDVGTFTILIFAEDMNGKKDSCTTFGVLEPNDYNDWILDPITGKIVTEREEPIAKVNILFRDEQGTFVEVLTDIRGSFVIGGISNRTYSIQPEKNDNPQNGLSTFDMLLIRKHILKIDLLNDSPYQLIAADINRSGTITTLDLIQLRKMILGIDTEFSNNTSWRFVDKAYAFPDPSNPWKEEFPETIHIEGGNSNLEVSFIGIKIGDVNGSAITEE